MSEPHLSYPDGRTGDAHFLLTRRILDLQALGI